MKSLPRHNGILLHPTSLPGPHGSGDLGPAAYHFVDWLVGAGQSLWQVLPLGSVGPGNSPYISPSAFDGSELLIDLGQLRDAGSTVAGADWCLSVADNGIGIPAGQLSRVFQVFQRLQSRVAFEGTGVGLALCRKIVETHGGQIWAESAGEGLGSRFCANLPFAVADPAQPVGF